MKKQVKLTQLHEGPIRHHSLPGNFIERIKAYKVILGDADPASLERTVDCFKRDTNPERELVIWERMANAFQMYLSDYPTVDISIRKDVLAVLLRASMGAKTFENITHLDDHQIERLVLHYRRL
jgi:hypothetical protein